MHYFRLLCVYCFPPDSYMLAITLLPLLFVAGVFLYFSMAPNSSKLSILAKLSTTILPHSQRPAATATATAQKERNTINETDLKMAFSTFDKNRDGFISKQQLLYSLGLSGADPDQAASMIVSFDTNHDGQIGAQEFCSIYETLVRDEGEVGEGKWVEDVKDAFAVFDMDGDGLITAEELGMVLSSLGIKHAVAARRSMIDKFDQDGDGMINLAEFMLMMQSSKPLSASS